MERVLIKNITRDTKGSVVIKGRVMTIRELGSVAFALVMDYTGTVQTVWDEAPPMKVGDIVEITGIVKPDERAKSGFEITGENALVIATSIEDLPIDLSKSDIKLNITTLLDHRPLSLRHPKIQAIFKLYNLLLYGYETVMRKHGFTEIKTPKLLEAASEGGANFFRVKYFEKEAFLAQSPQLYKQIMVGVFERVFEIGSTFRAEPHFTTRHVNEYISLDGEMGFIKDHADIMREINKILIDLFEILRIEGAPYLEFYKTEVPKVPDEIPSYKLSEIKEIIAKKYKYDIPIDTDIDPEGERLAGRFAKEEHNSSFIFLTHYPKNMRPFYTMPAPENPQEETNSFDLLFNGLELITGSQRIHDYSQLIESMKMMDVKPTGLEFYLNTFKYAMPPHGGWGMGSERLIQQLLGLANVKEAVLFPRDVKRLSP